MWGAPYGKRHKKKRRKAILDEGQETLRVAPARANATRSVLASCWNRVLGGGHPPRTWGAPPQHGRRRWKKRKKVNIIIHSHILNCTGSKRGCPCRAPLEHKPQQTLRKSWPTMKSMKMALSGTSEPQMCRLASDACNMTTLVLKPFVRQLWVLQAFEYHVWRPNWPQTRHRRHQDLWQAADLRCPNLGRRFGPCLEQWQLLCTCLIPTVEPQGPYRRYRSTVAPLPLCDSNPLWGPWF